MDSTIECLCLFCKLNYSANVTLIPVEPSTYCHSALGKLHYEQGPGSLLFIFHGARIKVKFRRKLLINKWMVESTWYCFYLRQGQSDISSLLASPVNVRDGWGLHKEDFCSDIMWKTLHTVDVITWSCGVIQFHTVKKPIQWCSKMSSTATCLIWSVCCSSSFRTAGHFTVNLLALRVDLMDHTPQMSSSGL